MTHPLTHPQVRRTLVLGLVVSLVGLAVFVLGPTGELPSAAVHDTSAFLDSLGVPTWMSEPALWAFAYNIALFVPVTCACALLWRHVAVVAWMALGLAGSLAIEAVQASVLAARSPEVRDLVANTTGAFVGASMARLAWWLLHKGGPRRADRT